MLTKIPNVVIYDIDAILGDDFLCEIGWGDGSGGYKNFVGCIAEAPLTKSPPYNPNDPDFGSTAVDTVEGSLNVTLGAGNINIAYGLTGEQVDALGPGKWDYKIQITHLDGTSRTYVTGVLKIYKAKKLRNIPELN